MVSQTALKGGNIAYFLSQDEIPTSWYNIQADLPEPLPPPLDPKTLKPVSPEPLFRIFAKELVLQEVSRERFIKIPDEVLEAYKTIPRPTPLIRAKRLEEALGTPARIYFKWEGVSPAGSHKPNTAIPQAYYNAKQGTKRVVTETGAGQWGSALAMACAFFGLKCTVYMVAASYRQKPGRRIMMETWGAQVFPSPSERTRFGRSILEKEPDHPGSLGIAISEALEDVLSDESARYCLGSVLNHVLMHQTVIGLEAKKQLEAIGEEPDVFAGNIGGGSNYGGFCLPFVADKLKGKSEAEFVACESAAIPHTTRGKYTYDFGDTAGITPLLKMLTLGKDYKTPPIHAGGLRYHGMAPIISYLINKGYMKSVAYTQTQVFEAAVLFAKTQGIISAPESAHEIRFVIDEARRCKQTGEKKVIVFNHSGHGLLDLAGYEAYLAGRLEDWTPTEINYPSYVPD
ncbi:TrpB-like pyridoxal-phosphate dependent enzyme [Candidatus Marsarchaeota G2 archaeon ECH_B_SAG-G16]|jgi:tryptophan synthase beta chain|uniref:Tryptophan synthase beta chain n=2 Tax=Candidatus Marsarchaeota TaxID=1978152 RepID=A0A2R6AMX0_9ARCH|nr:MAG: TrpB-like pyridoxal-phosphate dependent enzyme [Candidatus Marsarchaeota G1 archaeon OSP_C]PSO05602.1 MAG: TrpB-like pyridoxal-phosphate dependent enzyme [Candidatus Marsarchaeota G2 archaeon ECH_B_SAG-G16]